MRNIKLTQQMDKHNIIVSRMTEDKHFEFDTFRKDLWSFVLKMPVAADGESPELAKHKTLAKGPNATGYEIFRRLPIRTPEFQLTSLLIRTIFQVILSE